MHKDSLQWQLEVDKAEIAYLTGVFESYDDFAVVRTLDQERGLIELLIAPDYEEDVRRLVESLRQEMRLRIVPPRGPVNARPI